MPSQPIGRERVAILEDMGEDAIAERYFREGTVRRMIKSWEDDGTFTPRAEGESLAYKFFYDWRDQGGPERREWWENCVQIQAELSAEGAVDAAMDADVKNANVKRLLAQTLQWRAERTGRRYGKKVDVSQRVTLDLGQSLLEVVKQNELARQNEARMLQAANDGRAIDVPFWVENEDES